MIAIIHTHWLMIYFNLTEGGCQNRFFAFLPILCHLEAKKNNEAQKMTFPEENSLLFLSQIHVTPPCTGNIVLGERWE